MSGETSKLDGFVILGPNHPIEMGFHTFGRTMGEAWLRHIGYREFEIGELATLKGRWAEKGWRPVPATLTVAGPTIHKALKEKGDG